MIKPVAGVLPLVPSVQTTVDVADEVMAADPIDAVTTRLHRELLALAGPDDVEIAPDCVHVVHDGPGSEPQTQAYTGRWMPRLDARCELRGGPADGAMVDIPRDDAGLPRERWTEPVMQSVAFMSSVDLKNLRDLSGAYAEYALVGFRNSPAVWVYDYVR